jgi:uncharacterized membrane protein YedE/YeeE
MRERLAGGVVGLVFGVMLSWTGMTSPVVIRQALLFQRSYLFLFFASAVATAFVGLRVVRALKTRALLTRTPVSWSVNRPQRSSVAGGLIFGLGWAISDACPGPIATQLGQGIGWSLFTIAGVIAGINLYGRRREVPVSSPAGDSRSTPEPQSRPLPA